MILDRAVSRDVQGLFRHEEGDVGHDAEVRLQGRDLVADLLFSEGRRLEDGQPALQRGFLEWVGSPPLLVGLTIDTDDFIFSLHERVEDALTEGLLSVDDNSHGRSEIVGVGRRRIQRSIHSFWLHVRSYWSPGSLGPWPVRGSQRSLVSTPFALSAR